MSARRNISPSIGRPFSLAFCFRFFFGSSCYPRKTVKSTFFFWPGESLSVIIWHLRQSFPQGSEQLPFGGAHHSAILQPRCEKRRDKSL